MGKAETPRQRKAFDFYCQLILSKMPVDDSIEQVIKECGVSKRTVYRWKKEFNWDDRVLLRQKDIEEGVSEATRETLSDIKARLVKIVRTPLDDYLEQIEKGNHPVVIKTSHDLDKIVKLLLLIYGEATERIDDKGDVKVNVQLPENIQSDIADIAARIDTEKDKPR